MVKRLMIDSNVLIAAYENQDAHNKIATDFLLANYTNHLMTSTISLSEALSGPYKKSRDAGERVKMLYSDLIDQVCVVDEKIALSAAKLRAREKIALPDALILATAEIENAELVTFDKALAKKSKRVRLLK